MRGFPLSPLAPAVLALAASAQSFNFDMQDSSGSPANLPPATYGGPAVSPGVWNSVHVFTQGDFFTVDGVPTQTTIDTALGCAPFHECDDPGTTSPHELLLDDYYSCDSVSSDFGINNIDNGNYVIYTIVFHPCGSTLPKKVGVMGSPEGEQDVAGTWNGSYVQGMNYTRHTLTVTGGFVSMYVYTPGASGGCCADFNGLQLVKVDEPPLAGIPQCYGDGGGAPCPCGNSGTSGSGCQNSAGTGGARLYTTGSTSPDTVVLNAYRELPSALSIFLQGNATVGPLVFGDGLRCAGGIMKRLYVKNASGGVVSAPAGADPSITARSAALGDPIPSGERRYYQVYYRDANPGFCPPPQGNTFNATHAVKVVW